MLCGADFASLEDRINALISSDPNKLAVYEHGYDGHNLRAAAYFIKDMPDIKVKLDKLELPGKFFKVTLCSGIVNYYHESDEEFKELLNESRRVEGEFAL